MMPNKFDSLSIEEWRQYGRIDIRFHPRLTILTGANASGKSTLLGVLAKHFLWNRTFSSSPHRGRSEWSAIGRRRIKRELEQGSLASIGTLHYAMGESATVLVPTQVGDGRSQYDVVLSGQAEVDGVYISSHRVASGNYAQVATIPIVFSGADQFFQSFRGEVQARWQGGYSGRSPQIALKESLISAALFSGSSGPVDAVPAAQAIWEGFQAVLAVLLPVSLGFRGLRVKTPDLVVESDTGDFVLDEASGGMFAIIEIAWQIFLESQSHSSFVVVMDEPENHLHPSLQREIMPRLLEAFPAVQFVVATHSPFVVTSASDSSVFVLDRDELGQVFSQELDYANKAADADETLRSVLGLETTLPLWAEREIRQIVDRFTSQPIGVSDIRIIRDELIARGLKSHMTAVFDRVLDASSGDA